MSMFSKILAFLNLLGILGLTYLAIMTYTKRKEWSYALHRHHLMIEGLPLDDTQVDSKGHIRAANISDSTVKELFPSNPVTTQEAEVKRVKQLLENKINSAQGIRGQTVLYAKFLVPLAYSYADREDLLSVQRYLQDDQSYQLLTQKIQTAVATAKAEQSKPMGVRKRATFSEAFQEFLFLLGGDPKRPFEMLVGGMLQQNPAQPVPEALDQAVSTIRTTLKTKFDEEFDKAISRGKSSEADRQAAIAQLLLAMMEFTLPAQQPGQPAPALSDPSQDPFRRYFRVVGVKAALPAINARAESLGHFVDELTVRMSSEVTLSSELEAKLFRDRRRFVDAHQKIVEFLKDRAYHLKQQKDELTRLQEQLTKQKALVEERKVDVKLFGDQLAKLQAETKEKLDQLRGMTKALYDIRIEVRNARRLNKTIAQQNELLEKALLRKE